MSNYQLFQNDLPSKLLKSFKGDISIDTETLGLNIKRDRLCLIQLKNETDQNIYLIKFDEGLSPKLSKNIKTLLENNFYINFNIITDGRPNSNVSFEHSLKNLAHRFPVFLTINLCTEDDNVVDYYNDLDKKIGTELSGMDVLDDWKQESYEIKSRIETPQSDSA